MRIATYNVNGINGRLPSLLGWLKEAAPDVVCLQELKAPDDKFPEAAVRAAGYGAVWHGQKSWNGVAVLARGAQPVQIRRGLPGDPDDTHSRYIEAAINGTIVGCLYLPNGNPAPGPKFNYKLRWFDRLAEHAASLLATGEPVVLAGDYNVMATDLDVYAPERWVDDALFRPEVRDAYRRLVEQGWTDALRGPCTRASGSTPFGSISGMPLLATPVCASIICCSVRHWRSVSSQQASTARCAGASTRAIMRPPGSSWRSRQRHRRAGRDL
jgi:exodeoxyribonuclease-3